VAYDTNGFLTNITDVVGLSSSMAYDSGDFLGLVTNLTTPYGQTSFQFRGYLYGDDPGYYANVPASLLITVPTGGKELYVSLDSADFLNAWSPTVPVTSPLPNSFEAASYGTLPWDDSFYWGRCNMPRFLPAIRFPTM
jgi:hypothetical protein